MEKGYKEAKVFSNCIFVRVILTQVCIIDYILVFNEMDIIRGYKSLRLVVVFFPQVNGLDETRRG